MNYEFAGYYRKYQVLIQDPDTLEPINLDELLDIICLIYHEKSGKTLAKFSKILREGYTQGTITDPASGVMEIELLPEHTKNIVPGVYMIEVKYWNSESQPDGDSGILEEFIDSKLKNVELPNPELP